MNVAPGDVVRTKLVRLLYFVGAGFVCTAAINKWRDFEKTANITKEEEKGGQLLENSTSNSTAVQNAVD